MFLVVGQGNPGERYARTRHNLGFMVLDRLGLSFRPRGEALVAEAEGGLFLKPLTYYNLTGRAVAPLARFYKIPPERILVVHDEMDLPLGRIRFKAGGSAAGNRGVLSIEEALGTRAFHRLRLGIGKGLPYGVFGAAAHVPILPRSRRCARESEPIRWS